MKERGVRNMKNQRYHLPYATNLIFWGFFFQFFLLDLWYLSYLMQAASMILLWQGMRILKDRNDHLNYANQIATAYLISGGTALILQAAPGYLYILFHIVNGILIALLLGFYGSGMNLWVMSIQNEQRVKYQRIVIEYLVVIFLRFCCYISDTFAYFGVWILLVFYLVMMIQIYHIHKQIKRLLPTYELQLSGKPCYMITAIIVLALLIGIPSISWIVAQQDTLEYTKWNTHKEDERVTLINKGLPQDLARDISDEVVEQLYEVDHFQHLENEGQDDLEVTQYAGITKNGDVHYLAFFHLNEEKMQGKITMKFDGFTQGGLVVREIATLYEKDQETYGYQDNSGFDFRLKTGTNQRQYLYASKYDAQGIYSVVTGIYYQPTWFQYPYQNQSLSDYIYAQRTNYLGEPRQDFLHKQNVVNIDVDHGKGW